MMKISSSFVLIVVVVVMVVVCGGGWDDTTGFVVGGVRMVPLRFGTTAVLGLPMTLAKRGFVYVVVGFFGFQLAEAAGLVTMGGVVVMAAVTAGE